VKRLLLILFLFIIATIAAQEKASPIVKFLLRRGYTFSDSAKGNKHLDSLKQWPDTLYYNTMYKSALMGSATIPISFSNIEFSNGNYLVSPTVSLGFGYTWFLGDFIFNENDKITVDPTLFFGLIANAGLEDNFSLNKLASFVTGGFIGFGAFTLFGGYDFINKSVAIGIGGRIDFFIISQKYLHIFGKVKEVRRHKKIAQVVTSD